MTHYVPLAGRRASAHNKGAVGAGGAITTEAHRHLHRIRCGQTLRAGERRREGMEESRRERGGRIGRIRGRIRGRSWASQKGGKEGG
jgi:hypothetical protein